MEDEELIDIEEDDDFIDFEEAAGLVDVDDEDEKSSELLSDEEILNKRETGDANIDEFEYPEKDLEKKKYQGTKIIRISRDRIEIDEQTPLEWILFKVFESNEDEGVTVSLAEIENSRDILTDALSLMSGTAEGVLAKRSGLETGTKMSRDMVADLYGITSYRLQENETRYLRALKNLLKPQLLLGKYGAVFRKPQNEVYITRLMKILLSEMVSMLRAEFNSFVYLDKICSRYNIKIYNPQVLNYVPFYLQAEKSRNTDACTFDSADLNDLKNVGFSIRTSDCLHRAGITRMEQLVGMTDDSLKKVRNLGTRGYNEIKEYLKKRECNSGNKPLYYLTDNSSTIVLTINNQRVVYKYMEASEEEIANSMLTTIFNLKKSKKLTNLQISPKLMEFLTMKGYLFWDDVYADEDTLVEQLRICQFDESANELQKLYEYETKRKEKVFLYPGQTCIRNFIIENNCENASDIINSVKETDGEEIKRFVERVKRELQI